MKNKIYALRVVLIGITALLCFSSCRDFLSMTPHDKKIIKTVEDYRDILASYVYLIKTPNPTQYSFSTVMGVDIGTLPAFDVSAVCSIYSDETQLSSNSIYYNSNESEYTLLGRQYLSWSVTGTSEINAWNRYYKFLGPINLIIDKIDAAEGDDTSMRDMVKGEALVWRAYSYFKLLQYYSPYKNNELGIPVHLDPTHVAHVFPKRSTQKEVFDLIVKDCKEVLEMLDRTPYSDWNCAYRPDFVNAMLASLYMYKAESGAAEDTDWANARAYATKAMVGKKLDDNVDQLKALFDDSNPVKASLVVSDEFTVRIIDGDKKQLLNFAKAYVASPYGDNVTNGIPTDFYRSLFTDNDKRTSFYFKSGKTHVDKWNFSIVRGGGIWMPFRLADMYLIRSEAAVHTGDLSEALDLMATFVSSRYITPPNLPTKADDLMGVIHLERQKEFYLENDYRWIDMKRLGISMKRVVNGATYELLSDDNKYTFPIPSLEVSRNKSLKQNPGWENIL